MLATVTGIYRNGQIVLDEIPLVSDSVTVFVTFLEKNSVSVPAKRKLGSAKGKAVYPTTSTNRLMI